MRNFKGSLAAAAVAVVIVGGASAANAAVVFSDTFEGDTPGLNASLMGWNVTSGSVDVIGKGTAFNLVPMQDDSLYVDLDGSTGMAGAISTVDTFAAGSYTLTFDLAGQNRPYDKSTKTVTVMIGDTLIATLSPVWNAAYMMEMYSFTTKTSGGSLSFSMNGVGNENVGDLLDNVVLTAVPEASTWAMLLAGFAGLGFAAFRKSNKAPVAIA